MYVWVCVCVSVSELTLLRCVGVCVCGVLLAWLVTVALCLPLQAGAEISTVNPEQYSKRFYDFISNILS